MKRVLVAGIGNIFHGDDGFGVQVVQRMAQMPRRDGVDIVDFGIRGLDLAYALTSGYHLAVLVDIVQRGGAPGTLYVIEPDIKPLDAAGEDAGISPHQMDPASVLRVAHVMGGECAAVRLVACEPRTFGSAEEGQLGLSDDVAAAVSGAMAMVDALVSDWLRDASREASEVQPKELMQ